MKTPAPLFIASLAANVVLVALLAFHRASPPILPGAATAVNAQRSVARHSANHDALLAALSGGDAKALQAAGVPADIARDLALGRAFAHYADLLRAGRSNGPANEPWWRSSPTARSALSREQRQQLWSAQRELADAVSAAFGDDLGLFGNANSDARYSFLPPGKRDALRRIEQDYAEMMAEYSGTGGVQLPSDRERLRLLQAERDRDIAALLSPAERADYELRTSATAATVRARYGEAIASEDDFRKIYELQKAFDEKFPREAFTGRIAPEWLQQRSAAERQLQDDLRAALGDDKYAALRRAADTDLKVLDSLAGRLNLPAGTTDRVAAARESYAADSQRINADASLTPPQRRGEIEKLGARAKSDVAQLLGNEAAEAYVQRSPWLNMLQGGMAFSTNPKDAPPGALAMGGGQSVFPVLPAGAVTGGRQVINFVGSTSDAGSAAAPLVLPGPTSTQSVDQTQTISVFRTGPSGAPATPATPAQPSAPAPANPPSRP